MINGKVWAIRHTETITNLLAEAYCAGAESIIANNLHQYLTQMHNKLKKPVDERSLFLFLLRRVDAERIPAILESLETDRKIARVGSTDTYIPYEPKT